MKFISWNGYFGNLCYPPRKSYWNIASNTSTTFDGIVTFRPQPFEEMTDIPNKVEA